MVADVDADEALITVPLETHVLPLRRGRIEVVGEAASVPVDMERLHIGRSKQCALVLDDSTVSKVHVEVQATPRGVRVVDLNSRNGTFIGEASIVEAYLTGTCEFRCGAKRLRFVSEPLYEVRIEAPERFGGLVGTTPEMIELFAKLQRYAPTSMSMVIQRETGTGKRSASRRPSTTRAPGATSPLSPSTAPPSPIPCWKRSSLGMSAARSRERIGPATASSSKPTAGRCCSTRSAK